MRSVRRGFRITGRVQGVGFRWWTCREAGALGLSGAVANLADGSVEVHVQGPQERVDALVGRLRDGPRHAQVEAVREVESGLPITDGEFRTVFV